MVLFSCPSPVLRGLVIRYNLSCDLHHDLSGREKVPVSSPLRFQVCVYFGLPILSAIVYQSIRPQPSIRFTLVYLIFFFWTFVLPSLILFLCVVVRILVS